jgi:hypothetical protein
MRKLPTYQLICYICKNKFIVGEGRKDVAKYCSKKCYYISRKNKPSWNTGLTKDTDERIERTSKKISLSTKGEKNPMWNKKHKDSSIELMIKAKEGFIPWNKDKKFPGMFSNENRYGENNAYVKYIMKEQNISYNEYLKMWEDKKRYYMLVKNITSKQNISILENYEKRGTYENEGYHLDHIYPIVKGYENNIPPEIIGDITNLRYIYWKDNLKKADKLL